MTEIQRQLKRMGISGGMATEIRTKDGMTVSRVTVGEKTYVLKFFAHEPDRREIRYYAILKKLDIPTIPVIAQTGEALLLEDLTKSARLRLGAPEDLNDPEIAAKLAQWYRLLHQRGAAYLRETDECLYDESALLTRENLALVREKTGTGDCPVWRLLDDCYDQLTEALARTAKALTYNDFYYTNLVVARDRSAAFPFDYNLMGKGYAYADLRNVCAALGERAKTAFLSAYGEFDEGEALLDQIAAPLVTLVFACRREQLPGWAKESLTRLRDGGLAAAVQAFFNLPSNENDGIEPHAAPRGRKGTT